MEIKSGIVRHFNALTRSKGVLFSLNISFVFLFVLFFQGFSFKHVLNVLANLSTKNQFLIVSDVILY